MSVQQRRANRRFCNEGVAEKITFIRSYCGEGRRPLNGQRGIEGETNSAGKDKDTIGGHDTSSYRDDEECVVRVQRIWRRAGEAAQECR